MVKLRSIGEKFVGVKVMEQDTEKKVPARYNTCLP